MKWARKNSATGRPSAQANAEMIPSRRLQAALQPDQPAPTAAALKKLAHALRDEGMSQAELYRLFQAEHARSDLDEPRLEALAETMDLIWGGGWAKGHALFAQELSQARLDSE